MDAVSSAETSHIVAAARSIRSSFPQLGWKAVLGPRVRDKFATRSGAASFRGLSKGVGLASCLSCYEVVPYHKKFGMVVVSTWVAESGFYSHSHCHGLSLAELATGFSEIRNKQCCVKLGCSTCPRPCGPCCHPRRL